MEEFQLWRAQKKRVTRAILGGIITKVLKQERVSFTVKEGYINSFQKRYKITIRR